MIEVGFTIFGYKYLYFSIKVPQPNFLNTVTLNFDHGYLFVIFGIFKRILKNILVCRTDSVRQTRVFVTRLLKIANNGKTNW